MSCVVSTVQRSALVFPPSGTETPNLYVEFAKERMIMLHNYRKCLTGNTNLYCLLPKCSRVLIAYSADAKTKLEELNWNLGLLINLNPFHMVIILLVCSGKGEFHPFGEVATLNCFENQDHLKIRYLNQINNSIKIALDGNVESSIDWPDIIGQENIAAKKLI